MNLLAELLYTEPLIAHDANGRPQPALAESWTWDDAGRVLIIKLKPGVTFHDGTPLTADIVVELVRRHLAGQEGDVPLGFERVTEVRAADSNTVLIRLSKPDIFLLSGLNELRLVHPAQPDVGTGPFKLVRRQPVVEAQRFAGYHAGMPASEVVQILTYETQRGAWAALMRGEVDAAQELSRESVEFMERSSHVQTYSSMQPFYIPLVLNHRHAILRNVEVRRAIGHALDRATIVESAMRGRGVVADGPIWPAHWAYQPLADQIRFEPVRAAQMLDRAGLRVQGNGPGRPQARFSFRCLFWSEDPQYERIALMVQKQLFDIGIDVELEPITLTALAKRASSGDFDAFIARANAGRSLMFTYRFWRSRPGGERAMWNTGYSGADAALDRLRESTTDSEIRGALTALAQRFHDDAPAAFIAWTEVTRALNADIEAGVSTVQDPFMGIWQWRRMEAGTRAP